MSQVVFLHGYGANKEDLMSLEPYLKTKQAQSFQFLDAPHKLEPAHFGGRSWFEINNYELMKLQAGSLDFSNSIPRDLDSSLDYIKENLKISEGEELILGGFSQGSMCALHFYLKFHKVFNFKGIILYSSTALGLKLCEELIVNLDSKAPVFQSHGNADQILKFDYAVKRKDFLIQSKFDVQFHEFNGAHQIPMTILEKSRSFIELCLQ